MINPRCGAAANQDAALDLAILATCAELRREVRNGVGRCRAGVRRNATARLCNMILRLRELDSRTPIDLAKRLRAAARLCHAVSPGIEVVAVELRPMLVKCDVARSIVTLAVEIMRGLASPALTGVTVFMALEAACDGLTLAIACADRSDHPVMDARGARAFKRADVLARTLGGTLVRGISDDRMVVGFHMPGLVTRTIWSAGR